MFDFVNKKIRPIGLDIGHNSIKMIQLARNGSQLSIIAADETAVDPDIASDNDLKQEFAVSAITQMLERSNFQGRNVVSCLPNDSLKIKSLRLDTADPEEPVEQGIPNT